VKSVTEPSGVGTRKAPPFNFPFNSGMTSPIALAAPVVDGMMLIAADRARRKSLIIGVTVDGAHESARDAEFVIQDLGHGRETIRGAARVGNDFVFRGVIDIVVDADANRHIRIFCRRADEHAFCARLSQVQLGFLPVGEQSGRFKHHIDVQFFPREIRRVALLQHFDFVTAHDDVFVIVTDLAVEFAMHRIPFEQMRQGVRVSEIVDRENALDLFL